MSDRISLKELERKAYRSTFQDGLWDLYLAGLMACLGIMGIVVTVWEEVWVFLSGYALLMGGVGILFMLAKKYITLPRLGGVKFGDKRKHRKATLAAILGVFVLINILVLLLTADVLNPPAWLKSFFDDLASRGKMDLYVPLFSGLFVTIVMCVISYFIEFNRGMYIALLFGLAIFIDVFFSFPQILLVSAVLIAIPGSIILYRFIKQYPVQEIR